MSPPGSKASTRSTARDSASATTSSRRRANGFASGRSRMSRLRVGAAGSTIYELMGANGIDPEFAPDQEMLRLARLTRLAYEAHIQGDLALALQRYRDVLAEFPEDPVASELVRRILALETAHPIQRHASRGAS